MFLSRILKLLVACLLGASLLAAMPARAGGGGGGAPEPMVFTLNLGNSTYLQFGLILETATPEAAHLLAGYKPKIQHEVIMLMAGKDVAHLRTLEGKKELLEELVEMANHVIHEDRKTGVKEALFSRFLIQ